MEPRINFVTLAVADVERACGFYADGLGWPLALHEPGGVAMIHVGEALVLSLWNIDQFEDEVGYRPSFETAPLTLAHNLASPSEVDAVLDDARRAGARHVSVGVQRSWGGYSGYFADPDGFRWEVAYNPYPIGDKVLP